MRWLFAGCLLLGLPGCAADDGADAIGAQVACAEFVKDQLKSPATAEFSETSSSELGQERWRVEGAVDSENSFGAMIRNTYVCEVEYLGDDEWQLVDLTSSGN